MTSPLTDRAALIRNRQRAQSSPVLFLHTAAIDEIKDRLSLVNKSFTDVAIVTGTPVPWRESFPSTHVVADDELLNLPERAFDLVIHAMCLHWANDPVGQLIQVRRALRPDGLFLAVFPGGESLHELRACLAQAEADMLGGLSPRVVPMGEIRDLGALLQRAGFALPVADSLPLNASYASPLHLMREIRQMGEANALAGRVRFMTRKSLMMRACTLYQNQFGLPDGRVAATFEMIFLTGWCPAENQPKPLRPGSASARLADALGTSENPLKD